MQFSVSRLRLSVSERHAVKACRIMKVQLRALTLYATNTVVKFTDVYTRYIYRLCPHPLLVVYGLAVFIETVVKSKITLPRQLQ